MKCIKGSALYLDDETKSNTIENIEKATTALATRWNAFDRRIYTTDSIKLHAEPLIWMELRRSLTVQRECRAISQGLAWFWSARKRA